MKSDDKIVTVILRFDFFDFLTRYKYLFSYKCKIHAPI